MERATGSTTPPERAALEGMMPARHHVRQGERVTDAQRTPSCRPDEEKRDAAGKAGLQQGIGDEEGGDDQPHDRVAVAAERLCRVEAADQGRKHNGGQDHGAAGNGLQNQAAYGGGEEAQQTPAFRRNGGRLGEEIFDGEVDEDERRAARQSPV